MMSLAVFSLFAGLAVVSAVLVVVQKNAMHSVLYLAFTVLAVAGVFFSLQAEYLGAVQILVYGGGIVVLYVFVLIIVNLNEVVAERRKLFPKVFIFAVPALLLDEIATVVLTNAFVPGHRGAGPSLQAFSDELFGSYLVPFELASILLLAVLVGAIVIARRKNLHDPD
jgi:NADH-quinone oxidoreductase subunit J